MIFRKFFYFPCILIIYIFLLQDQYDLEAWGQLLLEAQQRSKEYHPKKLTCFFNFISYFSCDCCAPIFSNLLIFIHSSLYNYYGFCLFVLCLILLLLELYFFLKYFFHFPCWSFFLYFFALTFIFYSHIPTRCVRARIEGLPNRGIASRFFIFLISILIYLY